MKYSSWRNIGTEVNGVTAQSVLKQSGLGYTVIKEPAYATGIDGGKVIVPNTFVTRRLDDDVFFGAVGKRYEIVQNIDAFDFIDNLVGSGLVYEKAGQTKGGMVYVIASLPEYKLFGDGMKSYIIFQNSHDGSTPVKAAITTLRLVCENQFNVAFKKSLNTVVIRHTRNAKDKLVEAQKVLQHTTGYADQFDGLASELFNVKISIASAERVAEKLFPCTEKDGNTKQQRALEARQELLAIYKNDDDLQNFRGTGWGLMNAYADYATHVEPQRKAENWQEGKFLSLLYRPMDSVVEIIRTA